MKKLMLLTGILAFLLLSCEEHDWEWVVTREAKLGQDGEETETCSLHPGETRGKRTIHYWGNWEPVTITDEICNGEIKKCVNCGIDGEKRNIIPHNWSAWVTTTPATEEADGSRYHSCQNTSCLRQVTEIIPQLTRQFWAQNFRSGGGFYSLDAKLLATGTYCKVYADTASNATKETAAEVQNEFDTKIYTNMLNTFGYVGSITVNGTTIANNIMGYADWLGDGDGKLCILLLDIRDNYSASNSAYTGGYFWNGDLYTISPNSNKRDMIFIDTYPGLQMDKQNTFATLAHEMQHMISYVTGLLYRDEDLDEWIDEGLSSAAEWVYFNDHTKNGRVNDYKNNRSGLINKGNNFFVWGNRTNENANALLDDYSTVYLFFQWLRLQASSTGVYKYIIQSEDYDYKAVTSSFSLIMGNNNYSDWSYLLETWLAANRINAASGLYGYKNEAALSTIKAPDAPAGSTSIQLYPGEGVYSKTTSQPDTTPSSNIQYAYLSTTVSGSYVEDSILLTFNKNTNIGGAREQGTTTGLASVSAVPEGRAVQPNELIRIDARDMLRQNGNWRNAAYPRPIRANRINTNEN